MTYCIADKDGHLKSTSAGVEKRTFTKKDAQAPMWIEPTMLNRTMNLRCTLDESMK